MAQAPRADQLKMIEVARLDAQIAKLQRSDVKHPLRSELGELMNLIAAKAREIQGNKEALAQVGAELDRLAGESEAAGAAIREKQARLRAGTGMDSRMLLALQSEIATQQQRFEEIADLEYAALEQQEALEAEGESLAAERAALNDQMLRRRVELENAVTDIQGDIAAVRKQREELYAPLAQPLKQAYEKARSRGGLAIIGVHPNGSSTGGVQVSPIEVNQLKKADPNTIWLSEDYDCIVVLLDS